MRNDTLMKTFHFVMQGKGGSGKSFVANLIGQYIKQLDLNNLILDTDPLNQSLYKIKGLNCQFINILNDKRDDIDQSKFDQIIQKVLASDADHIVIDTGSSAFLQLCTYIKKQQIIELLDSMGYLTKFHFIINGGSEQNEAMKLTIEFANTLYHIENQNKGYYEHYKPLVLWLNPMPDKLKFNNNNIYEDSSYQLMESLIDLIIYIPSYSQDGLLKKDIFSMRDNFLTFDEFYQRDYDDQTRHFSIVSKHRMKIYQRNIYAAMESIFN